MTATSEILGPTVKPCAGAVVAGFLLEHYNVKPHVPRVCRHFLDNEEIYTVDWPPCYPDLKDTIEHLCDIIFQSIKHHQVAPHCPRAQ